MQKFSMHVLFLLLLSNIFMVQASGKRNPCLEIEKRPLSVSEQSRLPKDVNRSEKSFDSLSCAGDCAFKTGACCCLSTVAGGIITLAVLLTEYTDVTNKTDIPVVVKRQYSITSPIRTETIYPDQTKSYPHATWNKLCIERDLFYGYNENCLSKDEISGGKGGCDDLEIRVKLNQNNGDPKLVKKQCEKSSSRRMKNVPSEFIFDDFMTPQEESPSELTLDDFMTRQEQQTYFTKTKKYLRGLVPSIK